jgi:hypothetical protein
MSGTFFLIVLLCMPLRGLFSMSSVFSVVGYLLLCRWRISWFQRGLDSRPLLQTKEQLSVMTFLRGNDERCAVHTLLSAHLGVLCRERTVVGGQRGWQRGQRWVPRPATTTRTSGAPQRGQGSPCRP